MYMTRVSLTTALLAVRRRSAGACLALLAVGPGLAHPASASDWPDTVSGRLAAEVELGELASHC